MIDNIKEIISLVFGAIGCIIAFIGSMKNSKEEKEAKVKALLEEQIIPLMEEAERLFNNGEDRETWVLKKISDKTHIDFYKYKKILGWAKEIIKKICETTKIDINKVIVKEEKIIKEEKKEAGTNGVF